MRPLPRSNRCVKFVGRPSAFFLGAAGLVRSPHILADGLVLVRPTALP